MAGGCRPGRSAATPTLLRPDDDIDGFPRPCEPGRRATRSHPSGWRRAGSMRRSPRPVARPAGTARTAGCTWNGFDQHDLQLDRQPRAGGQQLFYYGRTPPRPPARCRRASLPAPQLLRGVDRVRGPVGDGSTTDVPPFAGFPDCDHMGNAYVIPVKDGDPLVDADLPLVATVCLCRGLALNDVNAADDGLIVYHEYTHGMTNRLVTDAGGNPAMNGRQPGAMDEGFADWYALDMLTGQGIEPYTAAPGELTPVRTRTTGCAPRRSTTRSGRRPPPARARRSGAGRLHLRRLRPDPRRARGARRRGDLGGDALGPAQPDDRRPRCGRGIARTRALVTDGLRLAPGQPDLPRHAQRDPAGGRRPRLRRQRASGPSSPRAAWGYRASHAATTTRAGAGLLASRRGRAAAAAARADMTTPRCRGRPC